MKLRTEISIPKSALEITHQSCILTLGSCFSEEIGAALALNKFNVLNNPFGTVFNPISIAQIIEDICTQTHQTLPCQLEDVYLDHHFHSSFYGYSIEELEDNIKVTLETAKSQLQESNPILVITLGTAWMFEQLKTNTIVSNCHKQDKKLFSKELGSVEQFDTILKKSFDLLFNTFPSAEIILTLSPVRHTKEGLVENQISKSILRVLCHELSNAYEQVHYFPSYEIVLDDLRDYRFYTTDLVHPSKQAVEYIWDKFSETYFPPATRKIIEQWTQIIHKIMHKPFYEKSKTYQLFLQSTLDEVEQLGKQLPLVEEINLLKSKIQDLTSNA
jgi:hypothetical protein